MARSSNLLTVDPTMFWIVYKFLQMDFWIEQDIFILIIGSE